MTKKNPAAVSLGRVGGKAGTGKSKLRGSAEYYKALSAKAAKARQKNRRERARSKKT